MSQRTCTPDLSLDDAFHPDCPICQALGERPAGAKTTVYTEGVVRMVVTDVPHPDYPDGCFSAVRFEIDEAALAARAARPRVGRRRWRHRR